METAIFDLCKWGWKNGASAWRVSTIYMSCIVLNYNRANGNICIMKSSFKVFFVPNYHTHYN